MEQARKELDDDALLVTSRLLPAEAGKPRQYEVVFASATPEVKPSAPQASPAEVPVIRRTAPDRDNSVDLVLAEVRRIRRDIQTWLPADREGPRIADDAARELYRYLVRADMDPDVAQQLIGSSIERLKDLTGRSPATQRATLLRPGGPSPDLRSALRESIAQSVRVDTALDNAGTPAILALVGPAGGGKTEAIAKLAVQYGLREQRSILILSADTLRAGSSEKLRKLAEVLGIRFEIAPAYRDLGKKLDENRGCGLILIDTPGFTHSELSAQNDLSRLLTTYRGIARHLVLPSSARCADMSATARAFEIFQPSHLIFSRMDEASAAGPAISELVSGNRPASFLTTGPNVPDDIRPASAEILIDHLLPAIKTRAATAA